MVELRQRLGLREARDALFWRDVFAEFIGTLQLVAVQAALPLAWGGDKLGNVVQVRET